MLTFILQLLVNAFKSMLISLITGEFLKKLFLFFAEKFAKKTKNTNDDEIIKMLKPSDKND